MFLVFLYLLNVVIMTRASWVFYDKKLRLPVLIVGSAIQLSALMFLKCGLANLYMVAGIIIVNLLTWLFENKIVNDGKRWGASLVGLA